MARDDEVRAATEDGGSPPGRETGDVFLVAVEETRFERTVTAPVDLSGRPGRPAALDGTDEVRLWGVPAGTRNRSTFDRMAPGDLLVFCSDGRCVGVGEVGRRFEDGDGWTAARFWEGEPAPLVFTVRRFHAVSVPQSAVNAVFGYDGGYTPPDLMRVADGRVDSDPRAIGLALRRYDRRQ